MIQPLTICSADTRRNLNTTGPIVPTVAIVDDDPSVGRALRRVVTTAGYAATVFTGGAEFLKSCRLDCPACAVLDVHMPGMDGFEVARRLRTLCAAVPLIVITAHDTDVTRAWVAANGALYLRKPFDRAAFTDALRQALRQ